MTTEIPKDGGKKRGMRAPPKQWNFSTSSPFTMFTFSWVSSLLNYGNENTLKQEDLPDCQQQEQPSYLFNKFSSSWKSVLEKKGVERASVTLAAFNTFSWWYTIFLPAKTIFVILSSQLLGALVDFYGSTNKEFAHGLWLSIGYVSAAMPW